MNTIISGLLDEYSTINEFFIMTGKLEEILKLQTLNIHFSFKG